MKNLLYCASLLFCVALSSCDKDEPGNTAAVELGGQWTVTVDAVDENGDLVYSDDELWGLGHFMLLTYNTAANTSDEIFINDLQNFWDFQVRVSSDVKSLTFSTAGEAVENYDGACNIVIEDGQILKGAATTPSGMPADSISFYVSFDDDPYPASYGYAKYHIAGYRYTGFSADEE